MLVRAGVVYRWLLGDFVFIAGMCEILVFLAEERIAVCCSFFSTVLF
jgi:hypothetical protein